MARYISFPGQGPITDHWAKQFGRSLADEKELGQMASAMGWPCTGELPGCMPYWRSKKRSWRSLFFFLGCMVRTARPHVSTNPHMSRSSLRNHELIPSHKLKGKIRDVEHGSTCQIWHRGFLYVASWDGEENSVVWRQRGQSSQRLRDSSDFSYA